MPNITVPATAEDMPKFDKAVIMRAAWQNYHYLRNQYADWHATSMPIGRLLAVWSTFPFPGV
ncbi:hypothetical protein [Rhizobium sp. YK2]|uniref:hypothetical protein n=1 Tax=Rhizobium sp. YK2 TaxID=1860096 RepID=UPI00084C0A76|nr:hypothetical protein [Rhizobium sp. YK2]OEC94403.1 hypothetical protein A9Z06_33405 [Rhizobium sp. YK2]